MPDKLNHLRPRRSADWFSAQRRRVLFSRAGHRFLPPELFRTQAVIETFVGSEKNTAADSFPCAFGSIVAKRADGLDAPLVARLQPVSVSRSHAIPGAV